MSRLRCVPAESVDAFAVDALECYDAKAADRVCTNIASNSCLAAITILSDKNEIVGIIGANPVFHHSATYWAYLGKQVRKYPKDLHKLLLEYIESVARAFNLTRVQTFVNTDNEAAIRHNERMGFTSEGILRKFGFDGKDQHIFSRVF